MVKLMKKCIKMLIQKAKFKVLGGFEPPVPDSKSEVIGRYTIGPVQGGEIYSIEINIALQSPIVFKQGLGYNNIFH